MKQRVVVQAIIQSGGKTLLLRRSQGRPAIVGKFELPGGTLEDNEQPESALKRHIRNATGLAVHTMQLQDVVSIVNREEGDVQHIFVVYVVRHISVTEPVQLGGSYDKYQWDDRLIAERSDLRDSAQSLLELYVGTELPQSQVDVNRLERVNPTTVSSKAIIYSDGGSRGNPGPSAAAFVIMNHQQAVLSQGGMYLGITTNNQAEYQGVRLGLEQALEMGLKSLEFRVDSMLVVNQMKGFYKIKNRELWPINERIHALVAQFDAVRFTHVPRELNQAADALVNKLLDKHQKDIVLV